MCSWSETNVKYDSFKLRGESSGDAASFAYAVEVVLMCLYPADVQSVLLDFDEGLGPVVMRTVRAKLQSVAI